MGQILETVILASVDDEERFRSLLAPFIESKEVPTFKQCAKRRLRSLGLRSLPTQRHCLR